MMLLYSVHAPRRICRHKQLRDYYLNIYPIRLYLLSILMRCIGNTKNNIQMYDIQHIRVDIGKCVCVCVCLWMFVCSCVRVCCLGENEKYFKSK